MARVLVVEDEPDIRMLCRFFLEPAGHEVVDVQSGEEALDMVNDGPFDLVLLDVRLPGIDGWEVLHAMRTIGALADLPVIVMSAHAGADPLSPANGDARVEYIVKPFTSSSLVAKVAAALR